jgi:hypothetical protein
MSSRTKPPITSTFNSTPIITRFGASAWVPWVKSVRVTTSTPLDARITSAHIGTDALLFDSGQVGREGGGGGKERGKKIRGKKIREKKKELSLLVRDRAITLIYNEFVSALFDLNWRFARIEWRP